MRIRFAPAVLALSAAALMCLPLAAHADTYNFSFNSTGNPALSFSGSGTLSTVVDPSNPAQQVVTSLTGTAQNGALTSDPNPVTLSLIPITPGTVNTLEFDAQDNAKFFLTYDNVLDPNSGHLFNGNGLAFASSDNVSYVIGFNGSNLVYEAFTDDIAFDQRTFDFNNVPLDFTLAPASTGVTPEPTSMTLLGTGLIGMAGVLRNRRRSR